VVGGRPARASTRGGIVIQALRQARTRLALVAAGLALAAPLVAYPAIASERAPGALWALGGGGAAIAALGALAGFAPAIGFGLATLALEYAVFADERGGDFDTRAAVWATGLLLVAELLFLAVELRTSVVEGGDLVARRLGTVLMLVTGSVVVGAFLLAAAAVRPPGGLALQLTGVAAVAGVLALVLSLARR
jgi:hypothetical protein